jgi:mono/diheme cytochrome c family protein
MRIIRLIAPLALFAALVVGGPSLLAQERSPTAGIDTGEGEALFQTHCAACHLPTGEGIPGAFPPLAGHAPELIAEPEGRIYPILVTLYGLAGEISVHGQTYNGMMPPLAYLEDQQIADVLTYIMVAWENEAELADDFQRYAAEEVAEQRGLGLDMADVLAYREALGLPEE